jgi:hypothetical protein
MWPWEKIRPTRAVSAAQGMVAAADTSAAADLAVCCEPGSGYHSLAACGCVAALLGAPATAFLELNLVVEVHGIASQIKAPCQSAPLSECGCKLCRTKPGRKKAIMRRSLQALRRGWIAAGEYSQLGGCRSLQTFAGTALLRFALCTDPL